MIKIGQIWPKLWTEKKIAMGYSFGRLQGWMQFNCSPQQIISEVSTGGNGSLSSQSDLFMELKPHSSEPSNLSLALLLTDHHPPTVSKMPEKFQNNLFTSWMYLWCTPDVPLSSSLSPSPGGNSVLGQSAINFVQCICCRNLSTYSSLPFVSNPRHVRMWVCFHILFIILSWSIVRWGRRSCATELQEATERI